MVLAACHLSRELPLCILDTLVQPRHPAGLLRVPEVPAGPVRGARLCAGASELAEGACGRAHLSGCVASRWKQVPHRIRGRRGDGCREGWAGLRVRDLWELERGQRVRTRVLRLPKCVCACSEQRMERGHVCTWRVCVPVWREVCARVLGS